MQVRVEILCRGLFKGFTGSTVDIAEGSTILQAVEQSASEADGIDLERLLEHILVMRDNKTVQFEDVAKDGDHILVLHKIMGG